MHLVYLYIKKYKALEKIEWTLDMRYQFSYVDRCLTLHGANKDALPPKFFSVDAGRGVVDCVSAVIGRNGSGKTTLAQFLLAVMEPSGSVGEFVAVFVDCQRVDGSVAPFEVYYDIPNSEISGFEDLRVTGFGLPKECRHSFPGFRAKGDDEDLRLRMRLIYFSPLVTTERKFGNGLNCVWDDEPPPEHGIRYPDDKRTHAINDISTSGVLEWLLNDRDHVGNGFSLTIHERKILIRFLTQIAENSELEAALDLPWKMKDNSVVFALLRQSIEKLITPVKIEIGKDDYLDVGDELPDDVKKIVEDCDQFQVSQSVVLLAFYLFAAEYLHDYYNKIVAEKTRSADAVDSLLDLIRDLREQLDDFKAAEEIENDLIETLESGPWEEVRFESLGIFLKALRKFAKAEDVRREGDLLRISFAKRNETVYADYLDMMESYFELRGREDFCSFGFLLQPSSGEMAYLMMWARLYNAFTNMRDGRGGQKNALLFMDEAETAMHPEWQRQLVSRVIRLWEATMPTDCHLQIVFGSHSPILLSDIPKGNVLFLGRNKAERTEMESIADTFGANIFDLYAMPFFLEQGPVGEFARQKINILLRYLRNGRLCADVDCPCRDEKGVLSKEDAVKLAGLVGDTYVRRYVFDRLQIKDPLDQHDATEVRS